MKFRLELFGIAIAVLSLAQVSALAVSQYQVVDRRSEWDSTNLLAQRQSNDPQYWLDQGDSLLDSEQYQEALEAYDRAIELNPELAEDWYSRGRALY